MSEMKTQVIKSLRRYRAIVSNKNMDRLEEVSRRYVVHVMKKAPLEACLLQTPIVETWLTLILEHKLLLVSLENLKNGTYFDFEYKNDHTHLSDLIRAYKIFFPELHEELKIFKDNRNKISHFMHEKTLPTMNDVLQGDELIKKLKQINKALFDRLKSTQKGFK